MCVLQICTLSRELKYTNGFRGKVRTCLFSEWKNKATKLPGKEKHSKTFGHGVTAETSLWLWATRFWLWRLCVPQLTNKNQMMKMLFFSSQSKPGYYEVGIIFPHPPHDLIAKEQWRCTTYLHDPPLAAVPDFIESHDSDTDGRCGVTKFIVKASMFYHHQWVSGLWWSS